MANISSYLQKAVLDWIGGGAAATQPAQRWAALSLGTPFSTNFTGSEPGGAAANTGYSRQTVLFGAAASPAGSMSNTASIVFGPFSVSMAIQGAALLETASVSSGSLLLFGTLATARTVLPGDTLVFAAGNFLATLS